MGNVSERVWGLATTVSWPYLSDEQLTAEIEAWVARGRNGLCVGPDRLPTHALAECERLGVELRQFGYYQHVETDDGPAFPCHVHGGWCLSHENGA